MNRKENFLIAFVILSLAATIGVLSKDSAYDCTQPLFSRHASCSLVGGPCVDAPKKAGATGLWHYLNPLEIKEDQHGFTIKYTPDCTVNIRKDTTKKCKIVGYMHTSADCH